MPSGRWLNHSGCSVSHGWSALQLRAKSSAISIPCSRAAATRASKEATSPRLGSIASWPPSSEPIAQGLPGSSGPAVERVVAPLAVGLADRVDRRQVDHVEAELGQLRQLRADAVEAAPGAREELIPGAEAGALALDLDAQRRGGDEVAAIGVALDRLEQARRQHRVELRLEIGGLVVGDRRARRRSAAPSVTAAVCVARAAGPRLPRPRWLRSSPPAARLRLDLVVPGGEVVGEGADLEGPDAFAVGDEGAGPAVAVDLAVGPLHRGLGPVAVRRPVAKHRPDRVVAVAEDLGRGLDRLADRALHVEAPTVDLRSDVEDADARRRWRQLGRGTVARGLDLGRGFIAARSVEVIAVTPKSARHPPTNRARQMCDSADDGYWHRTPYLPDIRTGVTRSLCFLVTDGPIVRVGTPYACKRRANAPDLPAGRSARRGGLRLRRLACRSGSELLADAAPGPGRRGRLPV